MPQRDGSRKWTVTKRQIAENPQEIGEYWQRRKNQDADLWVLELDHPKAAQFLNG